MSILETTVTLKRKHQCTKQSIEKHSEKTHSNNTDDNEKTILITDDTEKTRITNVGFSLTTDYM